MSGGQYLFFSKDCRAYDRNNDAYRNNFHKYQSKTQQRILIPFLPRLDLLQCRIELGFILRLIFCLIDKMLPHLVRKIRR